MRGKRKGKQNVKEEDKYIINVWLLYIINAEERKSNNHDIYQKCCLRIQTMSD